ncbi:RluA family pseudouridine synthase [Candidatus Peregrinibacteria bacterium]|nr:RluA family pseudouridine synthase [Candidatus Peregrinibacteria bacterium]
MKKPIQILYEDPYLLAINKPPRVASVPGSNLALQETVMGKIQLQLRGRDFVPYLIHRLDLETSGVLLFGKHEKDRRALEQIFRHPETRKKYVALVRGFPTGKVIAKKLKARESDEMIDSQTNYKVLDVFKAPAPLCALVEAEIKTGRKHQIRQHFAMVGHPIIMDSRYGDFHFNRKFRIKYHLGRQFLHAASISFHHPLLKKQIHIEAPLAPDLKVILKRLSF